jgi:hypothetical protein
MKHVDDRRYYIGAGCPEKRDLAVLMGGRPDARVNADRTNVGPIAAVAVDQIDRMNRAIQQRVKIPEQILFHAEHPAEVVPGPGGKGTDGDIIKKRGTVYTLVEGPISTTGVDTQFFTVRTVTPDFFDGVHRRSRHIDFKRIFTILKSGIRPGTYLRALIASACDGIDDKKVLHFVSAFLTIYNL